MSNIQKKNSKTIYSSKKFIFSKIYIFKNSNERKKKKQLSIFSIHTWLDRGELPCAQSEWMSFVGLEDGECKIVY